MFTGRVFSILASRNGGFELHLVNRGNYPVELERVTQYKYDRRGAGAIAGVLPDAEYDAVVDFCAYEPGDISRIADSLGTRVRQYIFFSTASVSAPGSGFLDENAPLTGPDGTDDDAAAEYIRKKIMLERELAFSCEEKGPGCTILRPAFIYGPFNYAPRESYFIELIAKKRAVPFPADASSRFNFVYVMDIAEALMACIGDERAYGGVFNLAGPEAVTYGRYIAELERCNGAPFMISETSVEEAEKENIPLPFPLTGDTLADGGKFARTFDFRYTPFSEGMDKTFRTFYSLYN